MRLLLCTLQLQLQPDDLPSQLRELLHLLLLNLQLAMLLLLLLHTSSAATCQHRLLLARRARSSAWQHPRMLPAPQLVRAAVSLLLLVRTAALQQLPVCGQLASIGCAASSSCCCRPRGRAPQAGRLAPARPRATWPQQSRQLLPAVNSTNSRAVASYAGMRVLHDCAHGMQEHLQLLLSVGQLLQRVGRWAATHRQALLLLLCCCQAAEHFNDVLLLLLELPQHTKC
jgi:hypothetical protein